MQDQLTRAKEWLANSCLEIIEDGLKDHCKVDFKNKIFTLKVKDLPKGDYYEICRVNDCFPFEKIISYLEDPGFVAYVAESNIFGKMIHVGWR